MKIIPHLKSYIREYQLFYFRNLDRVERYKFLAFTFGSVDFSLYCIHKEFVKKRDFIVMKIFIPICEFLNKLIEKILGV
jgi:hypothetical protein